MATSTAEQVFERARRAAEDYTPDVTAIRKQLDKSFRKARRNVGNAADHGIDVTDRYVRKHPWTAVAIAAGAVAIVAGIALAGVVSSNSRRRWRFR